MRSNTIDVFLSDSTKPMVNDMRIGTDEYNLSHDILFLWKHITGALLQQMRSDGVPHANDDGF